MPVAWSARSGWLLLLGAGASLVSAILVVVFWRSPNPPLAAPVPNAVPDAPSWPHLRGSGYDAISSEVGLAESWPHEGPPVLWTLELGQGYSGFVAANGRVYTQAQRFGGQFVICLDADTGAEVWRYRYGWSWKAAGLYPGPYATPTLHAGRLYFAAPDGLVGCLDAETGLAFWSLNILEKFQGDGAGFGFACSPLVEEGLVIFPVGGPGASLVALDARTGATAWQTGDDPGSYTPAFPITLQGTRRVVAFLRNTLVIVDLRTGAPFWRQTVSSHYDEHAAWPLYAEPDLMISAPFRSGAQCFRLDPRVPDRPATTRWATRTFCNDVCSSVLLDGAVYGFDLREAQANVHRASRGTFRCLEFATGKEHWSTDRIGHASVLAADGKLFLLNDLGTLILARAQTAEYEELGRIQALSGLPCWTPPTLCGRRLYVRDQQRAVCLHVGKPEELAPEQRLATTANSLPRAPAWSWSVVLGQEPDFPNDLPTWNDVILWYLACLALLALAVPFAWFGERTFWISTFLLGSAGTTLFGYAGRLFVLTWPLALYGAFQVVLQIVLREKKSWKTRLTGLAFLALCLGYYELCKRVGLPTGPAFLTGFLPAVPFAIAVARTSSLTGRVVLIPLAFSTCYWGSVLFLFCRAVVA